MPAEQATQRFRVGEVPPLAEGYTDRPDTARGIVEMLVPGKTLALVPGSAFAEGPSNWLGACGKTQIAVIIAESLWRSDAIDVLIWIPATSRESVLAAYVEASAPAFGIAPTGTAESVAARLVSWLSTTDQRWLVVLDDLQDPADLDGLWPEGSSGRVLVTSSQSALVSGRHGIPGSVFSTQAVASYLGGAVTPFSSGVDPKPAWDALLAIERAGLISVNRAVSPPTILVNSVLQAAIRLAAPSNVQEPAARTAASALLETWPFEEPSPWTAASLRSNTAGLHDAAPDVLWADGCHPLLLRAGRSLDNARLIGPAVEYWRDP